MLCFGKNEVSHKGNLVHIWVNYGLLGQQEESSQHTLNARQGSRFTLASSIHPPYSVPRMDELV